MKILALDIETKPAVVYTWSLYQPIIGIEQIIDPGGLLCFSSKWVGKPKMTFRSEWDNGKLEMVQDLWGLLDEADSVLHFNGSSFDVPHIQREFMEGGFSPPSPFKQIDLYQTIKRKARFLSNKFDHVSQQLGMEGKVHHDGFALWKRVMDGDEKAQRLMKRYNIRDTKLLEGAYGILQPWITSHPSHAAHTGDAVCPRCGSSDLQRRGYAVTTTGKYPRLHCQNCGGWSRENKRASGTTVVQI